MENPRNTDASRQRQRTRTGEASRTAQSPSSRGTRNELSRNREQTTRTSARSASTRQRSFDERATNRPQPTRAGNAPRSRQASAPAQRRSASLQTQAARRSGQRPRPTQPTRTRQAPSASRAPQASLPLPALIAAAVILVILIVFVITRCTASPTETSNDSAAQQAENTQSQESTEQVEAQTVNAPSVESIVASLPDLYGDEYKQDLAERAQTNADVLWIAEHADDYGFIDGYIQWKMLRLAAWEPDATEFVRNVIDRYPASTASAWDGTVTKGEVPHLYQWDTKWGYTEYCGLPFGMSGCCPTAFSMVAMALTGSTECTPYVAGQDAESHGYAAEYTGSDGSFITDRSYAYGFNAYMSNLSASDLVSTLQAGSLVIINVGPGDFTTGGHFIVATGVAANGEIIINDPYSSVKSAQTWDADRIVDQTQAFYVCYA